MHTISAFVLLALLALGVFGQTTTRTTKGTATTTKATTTTRTTTGTTTTTTTTPPPPIFVWKWLNLWDDRTSWVGNTLPKSTSDVSFPAIMSTFGAEDCSELQGEAAANCNVGSVIELRTEKPLLARSIAPPSNGRLVFTRNGRLVLGSSTSKPVKSVWKDRGALSRDFQCAANWVISGTTENPQFRPPCDGDIVDFRDAFGVLVSVSGNVFVKQIYDSENNVLADNRQVTGLPINTNLTLCPKPYAPTVTGAEYCHASCINTCPELNPNPKSGAGTVIDQNMEELDHLTDALSNLYNDTAPLLGLVAITGYVDFIAPFNTGSDVIQSVWGRVEYDMASHFNFDISFSCNLASGGRSGITCFVQGQFPAAKALAFGFVSGSSNGQTLYTFRAGTLNGLFDDIVQNWYTYETNLYLADQAQQSLSSAFFTVFLEVPTRFVDGLGKPFPASLVLAALATRTSLPETSISNVQAYKSSRSGYSTLQFSVTPTSSSVTIASVTNLVLSTTPAVFSVTVPGFLPVFLFIANRGETAKAASLSTIRFSAQNTLLQHDLPFFTGDALTNFKASVLSTLTNAGILTSQILSTEIFTNVSTSGRRADQPIIFAFVVASTSSLISTLTSAVFAAAGIQYLATPLSVSGNAQLVTPNDLQIQVVQAQLSAFLSNIQSGGIVLDASYEQLYYLGTPVVSQAEGKYTFNDLTAQVPSIGNPALTNGDCTKVGTALTVSALGDEFEVKIADVLPVTYDGFELNGIIECVPAIASQSRADQAAYFKVSFNATAFFGFFVNDPSYVSYVNPALNHSIQLPEPDAAMSIAKVRALAQRALYAIVLESSQTNLVEEIEVAQTIVDATTTTTKATTTKKGATTQSTQSTLDADDFFGGGDDDVLDDVIIGDDDDDDVGADDLTDDGVANNGTTTTVTTTEASTTGTGGQEAASSSSASLPIIPIAAAAGGGIILVVIIVIIVIRRNRRKDPRDRPVVAFENPMYDNIKGASSATAASPAAASNDDQHGGLYDEPAFKAQTDKENPMYHSTEDLVDQPPAGAALTSGGYEDDIGGAPEDGGYLDVTPDAEKAATIKSDPSTILADEINKFENDE